MIEDNTTSFRTDWSSENDDMINFDETVFCTNQAQGKVYYILSQALGQLGRQFQMVRIIICSSL